MDNLIDCFYGQLVGLLGNFFAQMGNMGVELFDLEWVRVASSMVYPGIEAVSVTTSEPTTPEMVILPSRSV